MNSHFFPKLALKALITFSLFLSFTTFNKVETTIADTGHASLTFCKESPAFKKRLTTSIKKLENRLTLYQNDSKEYLAIHKKIENTKKRFEKYENSNLLCGKDGLPRVIANGEWNHRNEFVIPGILFIYITGWIGWVGRKYLKWTRSTENAFDNEIIINIPVAISIINSGFLWPLDAWKELTSGELLEAKEDITISPR